MCLSGRKKEIHFQELASGKNVLEANKIRRNNNNNCVTDIIAMDTGGGNMSTIVKHAWLITSTSNRKVKMKGYQDKSDPKECRIVSGATLAQIEGRDQWIILLVHNAILIDDPMEQESLCQPFDLIRHGIKVDLTPATLGGEGGMRIEDVFIPFSFDGEKLYLEISNPTQEQVDTLELFELTSPLSE